MKFFKFLVITFPIYFGIAYLSSYISNSIELPNLLEQIFQVLGISLTIPSIPFTPLLKDLGMYSAAYWSFPTTGGIILSALIWETIFILLFLILRKFKKRQTSIS